jgi:two-component system, chemotaxis family, chemotaxis protein CheY
MLNINYHSQEEVRLPIHRVKPGDKLSSDVRGISGKLIVPAETIIREQDIHTMRHFDIAEVWVYLTNETGDTQETLDMRVMLESQYNMESRRKVLIVDDVESMRKSLRAILEDAGYDVVGEAEDGDEAVLFSEVLKPDVVMMDIVMQRMNGIDATREIKNHLPNVKIIILTSMAKPSLVSESLRAGADNFILKPFEPDTVMHAVKHALSR